MAGKTRAHAGGSRRTDCAFDLKGILTSSAAHTLEGNDILQFNGVYGYRAAERLRNLPGNGPIFTHAPGDKPWSVRWQLEPSTGLREYIKMVYLDLVAIYHCGIAVET